MDKSDIVQVITGLAISVLFILHNGYVLRWGHNYQEKSLKWYSVWRKLSFWIRVLPFPLIWHYQGLPLSLSYGVLIWIFYDFIENLFMGKHMILNRVSVKILNSVVENEAILFTLKLCLLILLFLSILFNW